VVFGCGREDARRNVVTYSVSDKSRTSQLVVEDLFHEVVQFFCLSIRSTFYYFKLHLYHLLRLCQMLRYDTIRDTVVTCAQKLT